MHVVEVVIPASPSGHAGHRGPTLTDGCNTAFSLLRHHPYVTFALVASWQQSSIAPGALGDISIVRTIYSTSFCVFMCDIQSNEEKR